MKGCMLASFAGEGSLGHGSAVVVGILNVNESKSMGQAGVLIANEMCLSTRTTPCVAIAFRATVTLSFPNNRYPSVGSSCEDN